MQVSVFFAVLHAVMFALGVAMRPTSDYIDGHGPEPSNRKPHERAWTMSTNFENRSRNLGFGKVLVTITTFLLMTGCAVTSNVQQIDQLESIGEDPKIVLMPPDIRYYLLTASGLPEPNAEWTDAARANFTTALLDYAEGIGADVQPIMADNLSADEIQYESLHSAVGLTLMQHHFGYAPLPSKAGNFDWSLGPDINAIGENHNADYALFVYYRDYQASGGRVAFSILAAAAGVGVPMGSEHGFASLVDLNSGDIVWFNMVNAGVGELRDADNARKTVDNLFKDIPTANAPAETVAE